MVQRGDPNSKVNSNLNLSVEKPKELGTFPMEIQETFLIEDLLYAMSSIEGVYIKRKPVQTSADGPIKYEYQVEPYLEQPTCGKYLLITL